MALSDKDIIITPNRGQSSDPVIAFSGASASLGAQTVNLRVYPTSNGTLSFEGSAGQLFSITNDLTGSIFSVNDVSGIPSIDVNANGTISLAPYSGNVGIGTTSPTYLLDLYKSADSVDPSIKITNNSSGNSAVARFDFATAIANNYAIIQLKNNSGTPQFQIANGSGVSGGFYSDSSLFVWRKYDGTEWMRLNTSGQLQLQNALIYGGVTLSNSVTGTGSMVLSAGPSFTGSVGVGVASDTVSRIVLGGTSTGASTMYGIYNKATAGSDLTQYVGYISAFSSDAVAYTLTDATQFLANGVGVGAGSTITNLYGFRVAAGNTTATNNYGFWSNIASATGRWNFYAAGTAANYFAGATTFNAALTYGGVTLSNSVTGTGSMVLSASPTLTGTTSTTAIVATVADAAYGLKVASATGKLRFIGYNINAALIDSADAAESAYNALTINGNPLRLQANGSTVVTVNTALVTVAQALNYGGVTLDNSVTGTGSMVLSASPTFTGTINGATATFSGAVTGTAAGAALKATNVSGTQQTSIFLYQVGQAVDKKTWEIISLDTSGGFVLRTVNDAYTASANAIEFVRGSGTAITSGTITPPLTLSGALTYGGVTLSNSVTGTGSMVLSTNPTFTDGFSVNSSGIAGLEIGGATGAYIDFKSPFSDDYDVRLTTTGSGGTLVASGSSTLTLESGTGTIAVKINGSNRVTVAETLTTLGTAITYGGVTLSNSVTGTGSMVLSASPTISGTLSSANQTITSSSANALVVGRQGTTSPAFNVDASTASSATGINIKAAAAAGGVAVSVLSSGSNENLTIDAKGTGTITVGSTSTGAITLTRATTMSAALTYGGVTLSNSVTGTGSMVLSASPTFTGTVNTAGLVATSIECSTGDVYISRTSAAYGYVVRPNSAGYKKLQFAVVGGGALEDLYINADLTTISTALRYGGVTLSSSVTGTGSMVLSTSPNLTTPALGTPSSGNLSNCTADGTVAVGYRNIPWVGGADKVTSYSLTAADVGKFVSLGTSGAITVPASTFAAGDIISLYNNTTGNITITCSAVTTYIGGTNTTKTSVTLATRGVASVFFYSASVCIITGNVS